MTATSNRLPAEDYGPHLYGGHLEIIEDASKFDFKGHTYAIDCETDEKDNCMGIGLCGNGRDVFFFPFVSAGLIAGLRGKRLVGHNLKGDAHWLRQWGFDIKPELLSYDTLCAAHLYDSTRKSYSLKDIARDILGWEWPTYKMMIHPGGAKHRITLDNQSFDRVARYCGMDVMATWHLYKWFEKRLTPPQREYVEMLELPLLRLLYEMEERGVQLDVPYLKKLDVEFRRLEGQWEAAWASCFPSPVNIRSPKQVLAALKPRIKGLKSTGVEALEPHYNEDPAVSRLLEYRAVNKLRSTYTSALLDLKTLPKVHTTFNQWGTITGRFSSKDPNLQNIPVRTDDGKKLRRAFIASPGHALVIADYSQIEYRFLAHLSQEPVLLDAFRNGRDVHEETARVLGIERGLGKTLNFAAIYGAQAPRIGETASISEEEAEEFLARYWDRLPRAATWISRTKWLAKQRGGITTMQGRFIALPGINSLDKWERAANERYAVSYTIQGSAAELIKMAMLKLRQADYLPLIQVHDELFFDIRKALLKGSVEDIGRIMAIETMTLSVPIEVTMASGRHWGAKE